MLSSDTENPAPRSTATKSEDTIQSQLTFSLEAPLPEPVAAKDWRKEVPSVSQLNRRIRGHIENSFFDVWVRGEISNFKKPVSGHAYFALKDATSQIRAVMFRGALSKVRVPLKDGLEILLHGTVTVYEAKGDYQLVADTLEPVGAGALQLAFEQLKAKLAAEGLFDAKRKKPLPYLPKRIGIITSSTGAAVRDILKVLSRRFPRREMLIFPASVQGEKAAPEICAALAHAEKWNRECPERAIDVLIVGRGGGSLEDMWPFNEECVARAISACSIPTISAVGHEIDFTIADFVADIRAPTPSAAAEMVIPCRDDLHDKVRTCQTRLRTVTLRRLQQTRLHLGHLGHRLIDPRERIRKLRERFHFFEHRLMKAAETRVLFLRKRLESRVQMLHSLSPLQVLGRGYAMTLVDGKVLRSVEAVEVGSELVVQVADGYIDSEVRRIRPKNEAAT